MNVRAPDPCSPKPPGPRSVQEMSRVAGLGVTTTVPEVGGALDVPPSSSPQPPPKARAAAIAAQTRNRCRCWNIVDLGGVE
ncbi:MAG: hypothetical protein IPI34_05340 [bacterium]|nr:hypothetical protein [bacterium]